MIFSDLFEARASNDLFLALPRVLVVEDDPFFRVVFHKIFRRLNPNIEFMGAADLQSAIALLKTQRVDMVVADHLLNGEGTGFDLWRHCQAALPNLPFLLTSGLAAVEIERLSEMEKVHPMFLSKPFSMLHCQQLLSAMLSQF
jgi:CheY-like chemotaxis protein